jgi:hypothetical protein
LIVLVVWQVLPALSSYLETYAEHGKRASFLPLASKLSYIPYFGTNDRGNPYADTLSGKPDNTLHLMGQY